MHRKMLIQWAGYLLLLYMLLAMSYRLLVVKSPTAYRTVVHQVGEHHYRLGVSQDYHSWVITCMETLPSYVSRLLFYLWQLPYRYPLGQWEFHQAGKVEIPDPTLLEQMRSLCERHNLPEGAFITFNDTSLTRSEILFPDGEVRYLIDDRVQTREELLRAHIQGRNQKTSETP